ncbi:MAG: glutamine--fructose-6-phosphate transaminase (isomerizing) [Dichotomicrobium sp.]
MCGIVGILGSGPVAEPLLDALRRLEYRGYDSAGIATVENGRIDRRRAAGKLDALQTALAAQPLSGRAGIGHTRWATHGAPTEINAHPHISGPVSLVHNGIIENFSALRRELEADGIVLESETDSEIIAHLLARHIAEGQGPEAATVAVLRRLEGAFALAIIFAGHDDLMIAARKGSPLALGHGEGEMYLGSDAIALAPLTGEITYLEEGDIAFVTREGARIVDETGAQVERPRQKGVASALLVDKGNYRHFMAKEIHEQPEVIGHTIAHYADLAERRIDIPDLDVDFASLERVTFCACGTAFYAGLVAKYWFERYARLPVEIDVASEFRYREAPLPENGLAIFISQSGETADTLAGLRYCREQGQHTASIVNVPHSSIARESDVVLPTLAGPEIGVASTKAFTCQLSVLACLAIAAGKARGHINAAREQELVGALVELPRLIARVLRGEQSFVDIAHNLSHAQDMLYVGRGVNYPLALEGALKLKEISYIHAEGFAAGELKHGAIALIDETVPVVVIAPPGRTHEKTMSNMQEVAARGGRIVLLTGESAGPPDCEVMAHCVLPEVHEFVSPILYALPVQLLAYHTAVWRGTDVDQPRNLAKSVTVE